MDSKSILYTVKNSTAIFKINREEQRNSISPDVVTLFHEYLDEDTGVSTYEKQLILNKIEIVDEFNKENADVGAAVFAPLIVEYLPNLATSIKKISKFMETISEVGKKLCPPPD